MTGREKIINPYSLAPEKQNEKTLKRNGKRKTRG